MSFDPTLRRSLLACVARLPLLAGSMLRWGALRGGWLKDYFHQQRFDFADLPRDRPIDVMVLVTDHFEPARRFGDAAAVETVQSWCDDYERLAARHRDADGRSPQHTWFYRYDYPNAGCLRALSESVFRGFGEVEFHLHHSHDTHETLADTLRQGLHWFHRFGAMLTAEATPQSQFAYIAGNWALDNGAGDPTLSGCDTELTVLREAGCYADFTFPALGSLAQPRKTNALYYAAEDGKPKSYNGGIDVAVGGRPSGDLLIFQGPLVLDWPRGRVEDSALEDANPPDPRRLASWLSANIHVHGRPEWLFVKLHTHAVQSRASFLGPAGDAMFSAMEQSWNRSPFRLHYVTAREAFNIVCAAEAGLQGNPNDFRDFLIAPPTNRYVACSAPWRLRSFTASRIQIEVLAETPARLEVRGPEPITLTGTFRNVEVRYRDGKVANLLLEGPGTVEVQPPLHANYVREPVSLAI